LERERCDHVIQFILLEAGRQDDFLERELGPIHLLKYAYLADLQHAERHGGETYTGAQWIFYRYGPWTAEVFERIEPALAAIGADKRIVSSLKYEDDFIRWRKGDDHLYETLERQLPLAVVSSVRRNVKKFGRDTGELLNFVYCTAPMRGAAPREPLVFRVAEPSKVAAPGPAPEKPTRSVRQEKKRVERLAQVKGDIKEKLEALRAERAKYTVSRPPRYDNVFFEGLSWLDQLGNTGESSVDGEAEFEDDVWKSDTRGDDRE
jgi:hypothetical protein